MNPNKFHSNELPDVIIGRNTVAILNDWLDSVPTNNREQSRRDVIDFIGFLLSRDRRKLFDLRSFPLGYAHLASYKIYLSLSDKVSQRRKVATIKLLLEYLLEPMIV